MIYTPAKDPGQAFILIAVISLIGIIAGSLVYRFFMVFALIFWLQYTAVLSYLQFKSGSKHRRDTLTEWLLHPQLRFFLFEFLAAVGLFAVLMHDWWHIGALVLAAWLLFSFNFYRYYKEFKRYE
jgi:Trk-type K+ transport system membrane component